MNGSVDKAGLGFKYHSLSVEKKGELLEELRRRLEGVGDVVFAYVHGSFVERDFFRDLDVTVWLRSLSEAFYYTVDFSAELEVDLGVPVDIQVLNEAPLPFKHYVFARGELLFSKDESLRLRLINEVERMYMDFKQLERFSG